MLEESEVMPVATKRMGSSQAEEQCTVMLKGHPFYPSPVQLFLISI